MRHFLRTIGFVLAARWRVGLLALVTALVWVTHFDRWTRESWAIPTDYHGDALEILARIQASAEGDTHPLQPQVISRLGAPFGANWNAYPSSDPVLIWGLGQVARVVGVFPAANLAMLGAALSAALAFYGCARWLRVRWEWAFATALLFAFTFQTFNRGLAHLFFLFSWTVPLALLACGLIAGSRRLRWRGWGGGFCVATSVAIGVGNPYTVFLFLQLLGWALLAQWLGPRRRENLIAGGLAMATTLGCFVVAESHALLFTPDTAALSPLVRNYGGTEVYALKPLELVLPPAKHRWEALSFFGERYLRWSEWRGGEAFMPYLGLVGAVGLAWLGVAAFRAIVRRRRLPGGTLPLGWVLAFSSVGGLTNVLAFFTGIIVFRASNRFSVFISALVLLFIAHRVARLLQGRPRWVSIGAAALVAAIGLADQLPRAPGLEVQQRIAQRVESDRLLGRLIEERLPKGAMVFQLPVMAFPEAPPVHQLADYEYFRPYLATRSLRFSYGSLKNRSRGRWQRDTEKLPAADFVRRLERYGFSAVYFSRRAFPDGGAKLLADLARLGRTQSIEGPAREQVLVLLKPTARPQSPAARSLTYGHGWHSPRPGEPRWAYGPATFSYFNPHARPMQAEVRLVMSGVGDRRLTFHVNRSRAIEHAISVQPTEVNLKLTLMPGFNRIDVESLEPAVRLSSAPGQLRAFAVHEMSVTDDDDDDDENLPTEHVASTHL